MFVGPKSTVLFVCIIGAGLFAQYGIAECEVSFQDGTIVRDAQTRHDISQNSGRELPIERKNDLELIVRKSCYRLDVLLDDAPIKTYPVALGGAPTGPKRRQGDQRTPEGTYALIPHHPSPSFGGCFYISYPNEDDARRAIEDGLIREETYDRVRLSQADEQTPPPHDTPLGGLILLHGTKDRLVGPLTGDNWTNGCIAMENKHLLELLAVFDASDRPKLTIRP